MRRVVIVSVVLVLVLFFGGADASYAATSWRVTGLYVPGMAAGSPYIPINVGKTGWGISTSAHMGGYASLMYVHNYYPNNMGGTRYIVDGPVASSTSVVLADSEVYCEDMYSGCVGDMFVPNIGDTVGNDVIAGAMEFGSYLAWVHAGSGQKEVSSVYVDVIPDSLEFDFDIEIPAFAPAESTITIRYSYNDWSTYWQRKVWVQKVYYAWYGQTGWREHSFDYYSGTVYIGGDDYQIDENTRVGSGHLLVAILVYREIESGGYNGWFIRDVWVGNYDVSSSLSGGVVDMPEIGYVDVPYSGGWYPVGVPEYLNYTCDWVEKPSFLSVKGKGNCEVEGIPSSEGLYGWKLTVTASDGAVVTYTGKIAVKSFESAVSVPGGTGLTSWVIGLTNTGSTGIGQIVMALDHTRVVFTNAVKSLNVTVDDSLSNFDTSKITQFVAFSKSMLPPGAGLPIAAWIAVTGVDVVVGFIGLIKGIIKWW